MPCDPCWQESSWGRGLGPARVDGINPPERDERKWGLQTRLLKSFAEKLSAKKPEFTIVIISMKNCFLVLGFFFLHWLLGGVFCLSVLELLASSLTCGILVPQPEMESSPLHWQHEVFNHWTAR